MLKDEEPVLKDEELVLEGERRTELEGGGSLERNERLRWSASMRWMIQRMRGVSEGQARTSKAIGEGWRSEGVVVKHEMAAALVGNSRRERWRNRGWRVNSARKGE